MTRSIDVLLAGWQQNLEQAEALLDGIASDQTITGDPLHRTSLGSPDGPRAAGCFFDCPAVSDRYNRASSGSRVDLAMRTPVGMRPALSGKESSDGHLDLQFEFLPKKTAAPQKASKKSNGAAKL